MELTSFDKLDLQELANKLFMYTDKREWQKLLQEVFTEDVWFDMQSAGGGEARILKAAEICAMWKAGFEGLDAIHHQAGHYLIEPAEEGMLIFGYAVAYHYKASAKMGTTRTFVGSYDLKAIRMLQGWRLNAFKYNLKFIDGNPGLE